MAKFEEPFEDTQDLYNEVIKDAGLDQYVNITILVNNKAKEIFKINKANELLKYRTGDDIIIVLNEKIFEGLTEDQRRIVVEESLASINYDMENDKLVISKPDVVTHSLLLKKVGFEKYSELHDLIKLLYSQEKDNNAEINKQ
jgi:hypothetical protein